MDMTGRDPDSTEGKEQNTVEMINKKIYVILRVKDIPSLFLIAERRTYGTKKRLL